MNRVDIHSNLCDSLKELYRSKNKDYGNSFSNIRTKYGDTAILVRLHDKLSRFEQLTLNGNQQVKDESIDDTLRDLANYALLELTEREYDRCQSKEEQQLNVLVEAALKVNTIEELKEKLGVVSTSVIGFNNNEPKCVTCFNIDIDTGYCGEECKDYEMYLDINNGKEKNKQLRKEQLQCEEQEPVVEYINANDTCCMCGELKELDDNNYYCSITGVTILSKYSRKPSNCPEVSTNEDK